jgi:hypothetical protein
MGVPQGRQRASAAPSPADLELMWRASPIAHVSSVKAPVTLMLGAKDRRVPPPDGLQYQAALRAAGEVPPPRPPPPLTFQPAHGTIRQHSTVQCTAAWHHHYGYYEVVLGVRAATAVLVLSHVVTRGVMMLVLCCAVQPAALQADGQCNHHRHHVLCCAVC